MSYRLKVILYVIMTAALSCGFLHHAIPPEQINFERLHIFLFNLCSGGTLVIYFTENKKNLSLQGKIFLFLALCFAAASFFEIYSITLILPLFLAGIVERVRIAHFGSCIPKAIFNSTERNSRKFHQASLLCLSIGLLLSSPVIANEVYLHWVHIPKLKLDTFFLGFSFPISLISMSVIFSLMKKQRPQPRILLKNLSFWVINLGVIIFFIFILANWFIPQVIISTILFIAVTTILYIYRKEGARLQQKAFLTSGIFFLIITSITGIIYILLAFSPGYDPVAAHPLLRLHAFTALYGWNLSGLVVVLRHGDFPIQLHSKRIITLHWITVLILCPLGYFFPFFSVVAVIAYGWLLFNLMFRDGIPDEALIGRSTNMLENSD